MSNIKELLVHTTKLKQLLESPEPGLITWRISLNKQIKAIAEYRG
jgi:hypothetical protein